MSPHARIAAGLAVGIVGVGVPLGPDDAVRAGGRPAACVGTITLVDLVPLAPPEVHPARTRTVSTFRSLHTFCPAPGVSVVVPQTGTVTFDLDAEGQGVIRFTSTLEYQGGTLHGDGTGQVTASGITGHVRAYGGTGALEGISGSGTFESAGPNSFSDAINYVYP